MAKDETTANDTPVDFNDPESIKNELAAAGTDSAATNGSKDKKEKGEPKPKIIKVTFTAAADIKAGETITFDYELPKSTAIRGIVAGIPLAEMTDDELKIEYRNSNSVYYKTKKAGHDVTKAEARFNACRAEMTKRGIQPTSRASAPVDAAAVAAMIKAGTINIEDLQKLLNSEDVPAGE